MIQIKKIIDHWGKCLRNCLFRKAVHLKPILLISVDLGYAGEAVYFTLMLLLYKRKAYRKQITCHLLSAFWWYEIKQSVMQVTPGCLVKGEIVFVKVVEEPQTMVLNSVCACLSVAAVHTCMCVCVCMAAVQCCVCVCWWLQSSCVCVYVCGWLQSTCCVCVCLSMAAVHTCVCVCVCVWLQSTRVCVCVYGCSPHVCVCVCVCVCVSVDGCSPHVCVCMAAVHTCVCVCVSMLMAAVHTLCVCVCVSVCWWLQSTCSHWVRGALWEKQNKANPPLRISELDKGLGTVKAWCRL